MEFFQWLTKLYWQYNYHQLITDKTFLLADLKTDIFHEVSHYIFCLSAWCFDSFYSTHQFFKWYAWWTSSIHFPTVSQPRKSQLWQIFIIIQDATIIWSFKNIFFQLHLVFCLIFFGHYSDISILHGALFWPLPRFFTALLLELPILANFA